MALGVKKIGNTFVWILMGLLIVGLAGFGATNFSGTIRTIGSVGSVSISTDDYARALQDQQRAFQAQTGQTIPFNQMAELGLDRVALERLVLSAAIESEVEALGISVGDEELQREILAYPAFMGLDGEFDREAYAFTLEQAGLSEAEFEADIRADRARQIVEAAILSSVAMPEVLVDQVVQFAGARRSFTWAMLTPADLSEGPAAPTEAELRAYYDADPEAFMLPELRQITYAWLTPSMLLDTVEVDEADIERLYEERAAEFNQAERRLVERLVFADESAAIEALDRVTDGTATFETLVSERGLTLSDVDLGDVEISDLGDAGDAVFGADVGAVVGPFPTGLGPALFHIGAVLEAQATSLDEVRLMLRDELARDRAVRAIERMAQDVDDLLAGGATLEELPAETDMQTGTIDFSDLSQDDIAAYDAFREAALSVTQDDFPEVGFLEDGSIFALRLDAIVPPAPEPFDTARDAVAERMQAERMTEALMTRADELLTQLAVTGDFATQGLRTRVENGLTRSAYIDAAPAGFMEEIFAMDQGEVAVIPGDGVVALVRLDAILPPEDTAELTQLRDALQGQLSQGLAQDIYAAFSRDAFMRADRDIDQRAVDAVLHSFQ